MDLSFKKVDNHCIIDLPQNIFKEEKIQSLKELIKDLSEKDCQIFLLNMGQISKTDSKSLAYIINIYKFANYHDVDIKLYNVQPYVSQLIYQTRLNLLFDVCDANYDISMGSSTKALIGA